jgi:hypothetical protein
MQKVKIYPLFIKSITPKQKIVWSKHDKANKWIPVPTKTDINKGLRGGIKTSLQSYLYKK